MRQSNIKELRQPQFHFRGCDELLEEVMDRQERDFTELDDDEIYSRREQDYDER